MQKVWYTPQEFADRIGVVKNTVDKWRAAGKGPVFTKLEGSIRYSLISIEKFEKDSQNG